MTVDVVTWITVFRILGEIKHSCQEVQDDLNDALKQGAKLHKHVMAIDEVLRQMYNCGSTSKEKSND